MQTQTGLELEQEDEEAEKWVVVIDGLEFVLEVECGSGSSVADVLNENSTTDLLAGVHMVDINGWYVARDRIVAVAHKSVFKRQRPKAQFA